MSKLRAAVGRRAASVSRRGRSTLHFACRQLAFERLEDRRMLATVTVGNALDVVNGDTSSIANLTAPGGDGGDGISLREAVTAANNTGGADEILFDAALSGSTLLLGSQLSIIESVSIDAGALADNFIIDAQQQSRIFNFDDSNAGVAQDVSITGLTLTGGFSTQDGGAIRALENLTVTSSVITGNTASGSFRDGGGIFMGATLTLVDSVVSGNSAGEQGGGIYTRDLTVTNSTISDNTSTDAGGGIYAINASVLDITGSTISGNDTLNGRGGGIAIENVTTVSITDSHISGNTTAYANGGGIYSSGDVTLTRSTVSGNRAENLSSNVSGGGIYAAGSVTLIASTISGNRATSVSFAAVPTGGGIAAAGDVTLTSSTVSGNSVDNFFGLAAFGGGIYALAAVTIEHSTIANNNAIASFPSGGGVWNSSGPIVINHSILSGNTAPGGMDDIAPGGGSLYVDFSLIEQTGLSYMGSENIIGVAANLAPLANNGGATCTHALIPAADPADDPIDNGDPSITFSSAEFDQRGAPFTRVADGGVSGLRIDMGAYERQFATGMNLVVDTIVDEDDGDFTSGDVSLREAVSAANGYVGANVVTFDPTVFATSQTILLTQGEIEIAEALTIEATTVAGQVTIDAQQQSRIFNITPTNGDFTLAGLTLIGGQTSAEEGGLGQGGAIRARTLDDLFIEQSTISGNHTAGDDASGGGIFSFGDVFITDSTVSSNSTSGDDAVGGAIRAADVTLNNSTVSGNSTAGEDAEGGGIWSSGNVSLTQSIVTSNSAADGVGGGVFADDDVMLTESTVSGNTVAGDGNGGGGIAAGGDITLLDSTLSENNTTGDASPGGGIVSILGNIIVTQSTVSGNSTSGDNSDGGGIFTGADITITHSTITDNHAHAADSAGGGIWNEDGTSCSPTPSWLATRLAKEALTSGLELGYSMSTTV